VLWYFFGCECEKTKAAPTATATATITSHKRRRRMLASAPKSVRSSTLKSSYSRQMILAGPDYRGPTSMTPRAPEYGNVPNAGPTCESNS
jgi:hypothetical protein